jgi:hypothetical protein
MRMKNHKHWPGFFAFGVFASLGIQIAKLVADDGVTAWRTLETPPAGWRIETNGANFRYVDPKGSAQWFTCGTKQSAVDSAWKAYEFRRWGVRWVSVN